MLPTPRTALIVAIVLSACVPTQAEETVAILRDPWGVPHVFADSDAAAFYALGYATAQDRGFQMHYNLRIVQGRFSEVVGIVKKTTRDDTSLDHDKKMRTFGFHRAAQRTAANLDPETRALLEAYSDGVNAYFRDHADDLHPLFATTGLKPELWTPGDCLASWWQFAQFFATDGTRDLIAGRNDGRRPSKPAGLEPMPPDDAPAVVKRSDASDDWIRRVETYAREHGLVSIKEGGGEGPKFSHAWVVGRDKTTTGSAVLVSDPQTPVRNPSLLYEFHVKGKTFNARGIGVPGSPVILIGFTDRVAWGVTALGADQADLFQLTTDPGHPDQYLFDGQWRDMTVHHETILIKAGEPVAYTVRETHLGPVATEFCYARADEGHVALKRIPVAETNRETIQGAIAMMRARNAEEFDAALAGWRFPSINVVFGDTAGRIGYRAVAAIPLRSANDPTHGRGAIPATSGEDDWRGYVPFDLLPGVTDPGDGFLYSGNHRPIESWYPIPFGAMTGAGGDTTRSWRLRERLTALERFTPEQVRDIHYDAVNPARRDIVKLAGHAQELSPDARRALVMLEPWLAAGASSSLAEPGAALAAELNTFFRFIATDLAYVYGGGESGLAYFLKSATARFEREPGTSLTSEERAFIDDSLASAWRACRDRYGDDPAQWAKRARDAVKQRSLGYYESLDAFPALDDDFAVPFPALHVLDGGAIACQTSQSYTQWVPMHDPDAAMSLLPSGQSERPGHTSRTSTLKLWSEGKLHPAPLSRDKVEVLGIESFTLVFR